MKINYDQSFNDRCLSNSIDRQEIIKIMQFYRRWHDSQKALPSVYQVSREWLPIYNQFMGPTISAFLDSNEDFILDAFENFFRRPLSTGLHGFDFNMVERFMTPSTPPSAQDMQIFKARSELGFYNFLKSCPSTDVKKLERKPVGNPYGYQVDDTFIYPSAEFHYYCAKAIKVLLKSHDRPTILELGGGYGGLAYYLLQEIPSAQIILIDLPENAALQAYYLKSHYPHKKIVLFGETSIDSQYDILIAPNYAINELDENSVDLTFNSYSLAEMGVDTINFYIRKICEITREYFYHLNHVYWEVSADDFPIDYEKFELMLRCPTIWNKDFRNYKIDQHEFVYRTR